MSENISSTSPCFDVRWRDLSNTMNQIFHMQSISKKEFMRLYNVLDAYFTGSEYQNDFLAESSSIGLASVKKDDRSKLTEEETDRMKLAGDFMYKQVKKIFRQCISEFLNNKENLEGEDYLEYYAKRWDTFQMTSKILDKLLTSLNKNWIYRQRSDNYLHIYDVHTLGMITWRQTFQSGSEKLADVCLRLIRKERSGEPIKTSVIKSVIQSYVMLGAIDSAGENTSIDDSLKNYREYFERRFLEDTKNHYLSKVSTCPPSCAASEYIHMVHDCLKNERERVNSYLHETTENPLIKIVEKILIINEIQRLHSYIPAMIGSEDISELNLLYSLLIRVNEGIKPMVDAFHIHITESVKSEINHIADKANEYPEVYAETFIKLHNRFDKIVKGAFNSFSVFPDALNKAFVQLVNHNSITEADTKVKKSPELIARYCDLLLRKGEKAANGETVETRLEEIMRIFDYINDKDIFIKFYGKFLAKRLISQTSASDEDENAMITKLRDKCGRDYASKVHRMYEDVRSSGTLNTQYEDYCQSNGRPSIHSFNAMVLRSNTWSLPLVSPIILPREFETTMNHFTGFYGTKHPKQTLEINHYYSKCELTSLYTKVKYIFQVSMYQTAILLLFNTYDRLSVQEIQTRTGIEMRILLASLVILLNNKVLKCLDINKNGNIRDFNSEETSKNHTIEVERDYKNSRVKVNLNQPLKIMEQKEIANVNQAVDEERGYVIQAAIVRIMKARKEVGHTVLIENVISQLSSQFTPEILKIKKAIDLLIEREFLERVSTQRDLYRYLA